MTDASPPDPPAPSSVAIVGGGIAGLATAWHLVEAGFPGTVTLIEQEGRLGGKIRTDRHEAFVLDTGPEAVLSQKPWGVDLCRSLGLGSRLMNTRGENSKVFVRLRGRLQEIPEGFALMVPSRLGPFVTTSLISPLGKVRMGMDWLIPRRTGTDDESLAAFVKRRLGQECLEKIAEPMMASIYGAEADELSMQCTFPRFIDMEKKHGSLIRAMLATRVPKPPPSAPTPFVTLQGGLQEMVDALVARLQAAGVRLWTGTTVKSVRAAAGRYRLELESREAVVADVVVLASPAHASAEMLGELDPALQGELNAIPYNSSATISVAWPESSIPRSLKGFGFVVPKRERNRILACTWTSSKWQHRAPPGQALLRGYMAGEHLEQLDDAELGRVAARELGDIMGISASPSLVHTRRFLRGSPQYRVGHTDWVARVEERTAQHPGLFLTGSAYRGVGLPDCIREGCLTAQHAMDFLQVPVA